MAGPKEQPLPPDVMGRDDAEAWGMLIADVTRHIARIYAKESPLSEDQVIERVRSIYDAEMDSPSDPGTTSAIS